MGALEKSVPVRKINNTKKEVIFIPMHHIGKREFYTGVKTIIDSLKNIGYVVYYEAVRINRERDSLKSDTLRRKMRQVVGADPFASLAQGGYIDTVNNAIFNKKLKIIKGEHLVNQPSRAMLGIDTTTDIWADAYLSDMIPAYEAKFSIINLTECDFNTGLSEVYSCPRTNNTEHRWFLLAGYRDGIIADKVIKDTHTKIAIVYGSKHFPGILALLQQQDPTWKSY